MRRQKYIELTGKCCRVLMLTFLLSLSLLIIQLFTLEIIREFFIYNRPSSQSQGAKKEAIDHQELIENSGRLFLADGTVHLSYRNTELAQNQQMQIYDLNDNLLWEGDDNVLPDKYLKWSNSTRYSRNYHYYIYRIDSVYPDAPRSVIVSCGSPVSASSSWTPTTGCC